MPLSTSSFSGKTSPGHRAPAHPWKRVMLAMTFIVMVSLTVMELMFAGPVLGGKTYQDNEELWIENRNRLAENDHNAVALLGASRIQQGFDTDVFTSVTGLRPVQLAIAGNSPLPVLEHLANTSSFTGIAIVSMTASLINPDISSQTAMQWLKAYNESRDSGIDRPFYYSYEQWLVSAWRKHAPTGIYQLSLSSLLESMLKGSNYPSRSIRIKRDRSIMIDYKSRKAVERGGKDFFFREMMSNKDMSWKKFKQNTKELARHVDKIQARGGRVIFLRMPTSGKVWQEEQEQYPKSRYWDYFVANTRAKTIHFIDYPELRVFDLPDGSHLDYRDAAIFTKSASQIIASLLQEGNGRR